MNRATVVIGALWGDEGKGLMVDHYASMLGSDAIVARFSGGANAGHTVVTPDGRRHVFSHFGSGTLVGCRTYLSQFFICNPFLWKTEADALARLGVQPRALLVDKRALVTTPYDMLINQAVEASRGRARHGSCGVGINETVHRSFEPRFRVTVEDLLRPADMVEKLLLIRAEYAPGRLAALGIDDYFNEHFECDQLLNNYIALCHEFAATAELTEPGRLGGETVIFEGSQGLLLDEVNGHFPHVTRARTGLTNIVDLARENDLGRVDVTYVSRSYMTRHGAGPFPTEDPSMQFDDKTNAPNPWQGALRFGRMSTTALGKAIRTDVDQHMDVINSVTLAVTWMDKIGDRIRMEEGGYTTEGNRHHLVRSMFACVPAHRLFVSLNPTRGGVSEMRNLVGAAA